MVSDGHSLVEAALKIQPEVIETKHLHAQKERIRSGPEDSRVSAEIKFVFLPTYSAEGYRREAQSIGAAGYVLKSSLREQLKQAIQIAMEDKTVQFRARGSICALVLFTGRESRHLGHW